MAPATTVFTSLIRAGGSGGTAPVDAARGRRCAWDAVADAELVAVELVTNAWL